MNIPQIKKRLLTTIFVATVSITAMNAQPGFDDDIDDEDPVASISDYTAITFVAAIAAGYYLLSRKTKLN
ncbi:hypothetical protein [uncultured Flavobacterium sp.]|uniref:hypothetical protein n=1 Tax=uncultured Flavobacterium sp. TaxID=165435 RepID=UPI0025EA0714|nr:hypothetical protein [uncultured Flavobacterium sp.]